MKGFKDSKGEFHPITDYKKGVRKSRDQKEKTKGVRMKRLTQLQVDEIKKNVLPLDKTALRIMKHGQGNARRDRFASPKWNSMTQAERLNALNKAGVHESAMGQKLQSREELSKLSYDKLPHYAKTDLGFHFFNLDREGRIRKARESDSGGIPPEKIFDKKRLTKHDGRYFLVAEGYPDTLAVDEYEKVNDNLFKLKRNILFSQSGEETEELLRVTGGGGKLKHVGGFGLVNEKKFLDGLDSSGALQESNFVS